MLSDDQSVEMKEKASKGARGNARRGQGRLSLAWERPPVHTFITCGRCCAMPSLTYTSTLPRLEAGYSNKERVYKMKTCFVLCPWSSVHRAVAKDTGDVLVAISNLLALQALQEEWKEESTPSQPSLKNVIPLMLPLGKALGNKKAGADRAAVWPQDRVDREEHEQTRRTGGGDLDPALHVCGPEIKGPSTLANY